MIPFAFVIHPLKLKDVARKYPIARFAPDWLLEQFTARKSPVFGSTVRGVRSITGVELEGYFVACPLTPNQMMGNVELAYKRIIQCTEMAAEKGAKIIGLGAFTSVVGDGGITVAKNSPIAVTTGNSYTVASAIEAVLKASDLMGIHLPDATLAVVGATGSIGKTCAKMLGREFGKTILVGRDLERTMSLSKEIEGAVASTRIEDIQEADAIITVTSSADAVVEPAHLRPGAIVCDVARPRDVSVRVAKERPDVLVIEGGVISVPGDVEFGINFGFPPKTAYACMSETMLLALEGRAENYTLGKDVSEEQVKEMWQLAEKHGFKLAGFRSFERAVDEGQIERAKAARNSAPPKKSTIPA